ncbi:pentapeptide repeat-containing protein [Aquimarina algiphila]|uniref:pentapeptide repeat-containing protein n=1 Tax=Aquimarina algiphila TaxID=2047982 RepID=UPI00232CF596|nr:pentapeptide repeat-containing protein [Aquimarina algiphila]
MSNSILDQTFNNKNFSGQKLPAREYDNCIFFNCNFSDTDLSVITFLECKFDRCNFNNVMMKETSFQEVVFTECKMLGVDFSTCNDFLFTIELDHCNLEYASFYGFKLKNTIFRSCNLKRADFTETNLTGSVFANCDLAEALFERTIASKTDFRSAKNYNINPESNMLKNAKFSALGLQGLLMKYDLDIE